MLSACQSEAIGILLQNKFKNTVIIAIDKLHNISYVSAKKFTKELYTYLYNTAGQEEGTPLKAYEYAIEKMKDIRSNKKNSKYY